METTQLARTRRHAIVVMLLFLASIPAFLMVVTYMDEVLELPVNEHPAEFLGSFFAVQLLFYLWMGILVYRLGTPMQVPWTVPACIGSVCMPGIALLALFILVLMAGKQLKAAA